MKSQHGPESEAAQAHELGEPSRSFQGFDQEALLVARAIEALPVVEWPGGYAETGLAILDSIWSVGVNYERHVRPVVAAYRAWSPTANTDGARDLVNEINRAGGPEAFADDVVHNHQRTSTRNGILKAQAVRDAGEALIARGVDTKADLLEAYAADGEALAAAWTSVRGQRSGITFRYLLMLLGVPGVKPDRMIKRFLKGVTGRSVSIDEAVALVSSAARTVGCDPTAADHRIWSAVSRGDWPGV